MTKRSLKVPKEIMDQVGSNQLLKVPTGAVQKGVGEDATHTWTEALMITGTEINDDRKHESTVVVELKTRVHESSPQPDNIGTMYTEWFRVDFEALGAGDQTAGRYKMSTISLGKLKQLVAACGGEWDEFDLDEWFSAESGEKPLVGEIVLAKIRQKLGEDGDGNPQRQDEITRFISES